MADAGSSPKKFHAASLNEDAAQPKHQQLRDYLVAQVESGELNPGDSLPSEHRLAELLGIARSTVRQALAGLERGGLVRRVHGKGTFIHEEARQRLKKGQDLLALIVPETSVGFYPGLQVGFEAAAAAHHNQVIVCHSNNEIDKQGNSILQLMDLQVAGVAIVPTTSPETPAYHLRQLHERGIPVVCCSRPVTGVQTPLIALPFEEIGLQAGTRLREEGHRSAAIFSGSNTPYGSSYVDGFRKGLGARAHLHTYFGTTNHPNIALQEDAINAELERLLAGEHPPTAIFATFDSMAELIYLTLTRMGLRIPEDISLIGFGGARRHGALINRLTSITIDELRMATDAIELLEQMRSGKLPLDSSLVQVVPVGISDGQTVGPPPAGKA
ncbi:substrate-binding domain-containing protein [Planctomicrobium sp. SH661]|uniref:LacI family DNA-binding transcriptional regulator n=1 Tax=Planctomicrobium sp. SH661 TaxID=3448124 RepID=UPI003F5C7BAD